MPTAAERAVASRGRGIRWRKVTLPSGEKALVAVIRRPAANGGNTVLIRKIQR